MVVVVQKEKEVGKGKGREKEKRRRLGGGVLFFGGGLGLVLGGRGIGAFF